MQQISALYSRVLGVDERETAAAVAAVQSALTHPLIACAREALAQGQCRRETPITLMLADGSLVEGVLDLAFLEQDAWTVVDFKTDRELEKELEHYKAAGRLVRVVDREGDRSALRRDIDEGLIGVWTKPPLVCSKPLWIADRLFF